MEFIEIENIEEFNYKGIVYDLTVDEDESYNIEGIIVHNSACTTSANVAIHYPMASLISECHEISKEFDKPTKIVADGGFKTFSDIIKALGLGADYVMLGSLFNKTLESCSPNYIMTDDGYKEVSSETAIDMFDNGEDIYKYYRGMSTKEVQRAWNRKELKTGEGITKYNKVDSTLSGWVENFTDYLKSCMSYSDCIDLNKFIGGVLYVRITQNALNRFNK